MNYNKLIRQHIQFSIDSLKALSNFVESNIENELKSIQNRYGEIKADYDLNREKIEAEEDAKDYYMSYFDDLEYENHRFKNDMLFKHRDSMIFLICSFLEDEIKTYLRTNHKEEIYDYLLKNRAFETFIKLEKKNEEQYLKRKHEIDFFRNLRNLRNLITHHDNYLRSNDKYFASVKMFGKDLFNMELIGKSEKDNADVYKIKLKSPKIISTTFENLESLFDKLFDKDAS